MRMADQIEPVSYRKATVLDYVSAGFAYAGMFLLRLLSFSTASAIGGWLTRSIGPRLKTSKAARKNLRHAFPEKATDEIEAILREVWDNMGRTAFEWPLMDRLLDARDSDRVEFVGEEHLQAALASGKPVLFFGGHLGNWEVPPVATALRGFATNVFYRAPNNPLLLNLFTKRQTPGELIPKGAAGAKRAFTLLKQGKHLGILVDQKLNDGIAVPFFGRDAMTGTALAEFALRFEAPMMPIRCVRLPGARFRFEFGEALKVDPSGDRKTDVRAIMTDVNALLENWIRENPGQWLWLHRRWPD